MDIFEEATKLRNERYDRDKLLSITSELVARFRLPNVQDKTKMRGACRHLADALDRCSGSTLQHRWNHLEKTIWPKWNAGIDRPCSLWTWGARVLVPTRMIVPSIEWLHDVRVNQWIVRLPEEHPLVQQHRVLLGAITSITWTGARNRHEAVCNGIRILLVRGYDTLRQIQEEDMKVLHLRWSKGTDALDAALCSLGIFARTPRRGSTRHSRRRRLTTSDLVEVAGVPSRFRQVMILYLETYETRVSAAYCTLRHKSIALAHFWRFIQDSHPEVKHCSAILPRHVRDYIPYAIARARSVQRGPDVGEEVRMTGYSWVKNLQTFFSDICAWATEPGRVLAEIIRHVKRFYSSTSVPICDHWDLHEKRPRPPAPYLLQGIRHPSTTGIQTIRSRIRELSISAGAQRSDGSPLVLLPHDCRRVFASEHLNNNTPVHIIQALLGHASPDTVMIYAKLYPSRLIEEYRKTVRGLYNSYYGEDGLKNPTAEEWAAFAASCNLRDMGTHLCALPTGEHCPRGLICLGCTHAQPKRSAVPIFKRMLASHQRSLTAAREHNEPAGQIASRELELVRIKGALQRAEELSDDVAAVIEGVL
jgi:hypothetical protein